MNPVKLSASEQQERTSYGCVTTKFDLLNTHKQQLETDASPSSQICFKLESSLGGQHLLEASERRNQYSSTRKGREMAIEPEVRCFRTTRRYRAEILSSDTFRLEFNRPFTMGWQSHGRCLRGN
jgi:hypothetical protein